MDASDKTLASLATGMLGFATVAAATPPGTPTITGPAYDGQLAHFGDVHMEATAYRDRRRRSHLHRLADPRRGHRGDCVAGE